VGAEGIFFKFWCGWITQHFTYMCIYSKLCAPATATVVSPSHTFFGLYIAVRADGHQEAKMRARDNGKGKPIAEL
jgi:hypothetical protein